MTGLAAPSGAAASAIQPSNRPTPIPGATNGELPSSDLVGVAAGCEAYRPAATSLARLLATAHADGLDLGTEQCYRGLADQQAEQRQWTAAGDSACAAPVTTSPSGSAQGTSMHGWGKAVDFSADGRSVGFGSAADRWLHANAGRFGWNHPGWAEPGGSACPEAWHWEWVGDGGTLGAPPIRADVVALLPAADGGGYASVTGLGELTARGTFTDRGSTATSPLNWVMVGASPTPDGGGYWLVAADGGVFTFGNAHFSGSTGALHLNRPIVGMAPTPDGGGYWLVAADGGVFNFGDALFLGSAASGPLNAPAVALTAPSNGRGYFIATADGGVFTFGDARFRGSAATQPHAEPFVAIVSSRSGGGYWIAAADGEVDSFGDAGNFGRG
jgi:hypothetical protein